MNETRYLQYRTEQTIPGTGTGQGRNGDEAGMEQKQNGPKTSELELSGPSSIPVPSLFRYSLFCPVLYNRAEITAAIIAIELAIVHKAGSLTIYTDSKFMINCIENRIKNWKKNGWKTIIPLATIYRLIKRKKL